MKKLITAALAATVILATPTVFAGTKDFRAQKSDQKHENADVKPYPLKTCIVSDDKLGEMGKPVVFVHKGQEIKLCCKECKADFDKKPSKYLKKIPKK